MDQSLKMEKLFLKELKTNHSVCNTLEMKLCPGGISRIKNMKHGNYGLVFVINGKEQNSE